MKQVEINKLRSQSAGELTKLLNDTQKELRDARRGLAAGELANPRAITEARKSIAQIMTVLNETVTAKEAEVEENK